MTDFRQTIGAYLTPAVRVALSALPLRDIGLATELRLRADRPAALCGAPHADLPSTPAEDVRAMADAMLGHAAHARQEELRQGFVTLAGGHRAGFCGRAAVKDGKLWALQDIASIAVRIARAIPGAAEPLLPHLVAGEAPRSALIVSPPGLGKTTMLRDAARLLSEAGYAVTIVDERSELAACVRGVPTLDVGPCTDVLDGCPKAEGMRLALRAMAPRVIVTDELGRPEDAEAVAEAARCGVAVIATAHGRDFADLEARPMLAPILRGRAFERIIALSALGRVGAVYGPGGERIV